MMQNIAKQHRIEALVLNGKVTTIVGKVIDARGGAGADV
jgi:hypothetical protein